MTSQEAGAAFFHADRTERPYVIQRSEGGAYDSARQMADTGILGNDAEGEPLFVKHVPQGAREEDVGFRAGYQKEQEKSASTLKEPTLSANAFANPKAIPNSQSSSAKDGLDRVAGPAGPPDDYWFPPGASTTRPNVNRNTSGQNGGAGAPAAEAGASDRAQLASSTTGPNAEERASASKAKSAGPAGNDQSAKKTTPDGFYIPNTAPKAEQKTSFEGTNDWVKRDLIEYHKHDPVKGKNFFESMLLIPHNRENAKMQEAVAGSMGDHAFRNAEYAKLLQSARPDIMRNYADEKTRVTAIATERVERQYGDKLQNGGTTGPKSRDEESGLAKSAGIKKLGDGRDHALPGVKHPYAQGREKASLVEKIRNGAVHATFGIAGGYAINKVIDHYSKKPEAAGPTPPTSSSTVHQVKTGGETLNFAPAKSGGRKL